MNLHELNPGDIVFAAITIVNDGSVPGMAENGIIAEQGTRGVIINTGHIEHDPASELMLVRFETTDKNLGPAVGCWYKELTTEATQNKA